MPPEVQGVGRVLFRVAAGPRTGFGHLKRCVVLAHALGVPPLLSLRGGSAARRAARHQGCRLVDGPPAATLARVRPALVVVDDPRAQAGRPWAAAAARARIPVAGIRDMGHGLGAADVVIDGSINPSPLAAHKAAGGQPTHLAGAQYALIDPALARRRGRRAARVILIALGGGRQAGLARRLATHLVRRDPGVTIRITGGFVPNRHAAGHRRVRMLPPLTHLGDELAGCTVALVGGGMTAYEACCLATPAVALAVVPEQHPAIRGLAARGAVVDGGVIDGRRRSGDCQEPALAAAAGLVDRLLAQPAHRRRLSRAGARVVDGLGVARVARELARLARTRSVA